jgi:hypothetical protein
MFCPKCGIQNPETGKFCRSCGTDLATVSEALSGKLANKPQGFGMIEPVQPMNAFDRKGKPVNLESAFGTIFMGLAFLIISIILGISGMGRGWWFWLLIPAFGMLGSGLARYAQLKLSRQQQNASPSQPEQPAQNAVSAPKNASLPPTQTEYVPASDSRYKTGDLVPPSVTDNTTRHLEMNSEGETMTLPKK